MERIHDMVDMGRMKCVFEKRLTYAGYSSARPVYIELGERGV
jgi:hypothetical protein